MRKVSFVVLALVMAFAVGCGGSKPKDLIVGKWDPTEKGMPTVEFKANGDVAMTMGPDLKIDGKYKFLKDDEMEVETEFLGKKSSKKMKVEIKGEELTTTVLDDKKEVAKFKKAK